MNEEQRRRLLDRTARAAAAAERQERRAAAGGGPPRVGDLYVHPATAEHGVEWLVTEVAGETATVVPADPSVLAGSADVAVPEDEIGGPLVIHAAHAATVPAALLPAERRSGRLGGEWAEAAHRRHREVEAGALRGSPLEREADEDPEHRRRDRELASARRDLLRAAERSAGVGPAPGSDAEPPARRLLRFPGPLSSPAFLRTAAVLLLMVSGALGWWAVELRGDLARLSAPTLSPVGEPVRLGGTDRGVEVRRADGRTLWLVFTGDLLRQGRTVRLEIVRRDGGPAVWASRELRPAAESEHLLALRRGIPPGEYTLRVVDLDAEPPRPVWDTPLVVAPAER